MGHYAKLNADNIVIFVTVSRNEDDDRELEVSAQTGDTYRRTSYNTRGGVHYDANTNTPSANQGKSFRKNYAGIGYTYDTVRDAFYEPKPYPSWVLNESTCQWGAPVPMPTPNFPPEYVWDEANLSWAEVLL